MEFHRRPRYSVSDGRIWPGPQVGDLIAHIYQKRLEDIRPPDGWEFTGEFGEAEVGERWLGTDGSVGDHANAYPRLILRKKRKVIGYMFTLDREVKPGGCERIYRGEWCDDPDGSLILCKSGYDEVYRTVRVFKREEIHEP
jgi:hypothetical protein